MPLTLGIKDDTKLSFWNQLWTVTSELSARHPNAFWSASIDANARVGSISSLSVGNYHVDKENSNGMLFRQYLEHFRMAAASTFAHGDGSTWQSTRGARHRVDYVVVRHIHLQGHIHSWVDRDIDLTFNASVDHSPVAVDITIASGSVDKIEHLPLPPRIDTTALSDPYKVDAFQYDLLSLHVPMVSI